MRCLRKNKQAVWYAAYEERAAETRIDEWDNKLETGEQKLSYGVPIKLFANVSAAQGEAAVRPFGTDTDYSRVLCMETCPFDEQAVLWLNREPGATAEDVPYDHIVKKIAPSFNNVLIAVKEVTVT